MKKFLSLLLMLTMMLSLCACGDETKNQTPNATDANTETTAAKKDTAAQIKAELNNENTIIIEGQQYALPMSVKAFLDTGWNDTYNHMGETIKADNGMKYPSFSLDKNGKEKISGIGAYNHTDEDISIEEAILISLKLVGASDDSTLTKCSFTLPGGITEKSTYEDVCAAYGTKTESANFRVSDDYETKSKDSDTFEKYGFTMLFTTKDASVAPYNYYFAFNADKTIKYVEIDSADYKSAAASAFSN